jgi:hypothetical protein
MSADTNNGKKKYARDEYYWRIMRHRTLMVYKALGVVLVIVLVGVLLYISYINKLYMDYEIVSDEDRMDSEDAHYIAYGTNVIKYSKDGAEAFDGNNNPLWNITYEMQNPKVATCRDYVAMGDFKGNHIYVINSGGDQGEIETKLPISSFCISAQGVVAAVLEDDNETKIHMYSSEGELLTEMKLTMTKSGYPVNLSLSDDAMKLGISHIRVENGMLKSTVSFYNFDEVGKNEIDNYVSGYDYVDCVMPLIKFLDNDTAFALGDGRLVFYRGTQKPVSISEIFISDEIRSAYYCEDRVGLVFRDSEGGYRVDVYSGSGNLLYSQKTDMAYTDIVLKKDFLIIYNDIECEVYNSRGRVKYDGGFKEPMLLLVPGDSISHWTLVNRDTVQSVVLN